MGRAARNADRGGKRAARASPSAAARRPAVDIEVVWADITRAEGDLFVVGHYQGVLPQNAELALDCALSGTQEEHRLVLTDFTRRGVVRGALGDVAFFPWGMSRGVLVAGMGRHGTFRVDELRRLARSVASSVGRLLDRPTVSTVLIGSGTGTLDVADSVSGLLGGFGDAFRSDPSLRLGRIRIVERSLDRAIEILELVKSAAASGKATSPVQWRVGARLVEEPGGVIPDAFGYSMVLAAVAEAAGLPERSKTRAILNGFLRRLPKGEVRRRVARGLAQAARRSRSLRGLALQFRIAAAGDRRADDRIATRISFFTKGAGVFSTAITNSVTVAERQLGPSLDAVDRAVERLQAPALQDAERRGKGLGRRFIHSDFVSLFDDSAPLVVEVDRPMARVQWEMLIGPSESAAEPIGIRRAVARQLRTIYSPRPVDVAQRPFLKALVIGDPGDEAAGHSLPHARAEAQAVYEFLRRRGVDVELRVGAPLFGKGPIGGIRPADLDEVVELLLGGDFDLIHYSGHAVSVQSVPGATGWVFKDGLLHAGDLEGMARPPMLVVANACRSAELSAALEAGTPVRQALAATKPPASSGVGPGSGSLGFVASLADEFFRRGIADYIGTAWEVPSEPASAFAKAFYEMALPFRGPRGRARDPQSLGAAVRAARKQLYDRREKLKEHASVWGAYQHYGDPTRKLDLGGRP